MHLPNFTAERAIHESCSQFRMQELVQGVSDSVTPQARCFKDDLCVRIDSQLYCIEVWNCTGKMLPLWFD